MYFCDQIHVSLFFFFFTGSSCICYANNFWKILVCSSLEASLDQYYLKSSEHLPCDQFWGRCVLQRSRGLRWAGAFLLRGLSRQTREPPCPSSPREGGWGGFGGARSPLPAVQRQPIREKEQAGAWRTGWANRAWHISQAMAQQFAQAE